MLLILRSVNPTVVVDQHVSYDRKKMLAACPFLDMLGVCISGEVYIVKYRLIFASCCVFRGTFSGLLYGFGAPSKCWAW